MIASTPFQFFREHPMRAIFLLHKSFTSQMAKVSDGRRAKSYTRVP